MEPLLAVTALLAHSGDVETSSTGTIALTIILVSVLVAIWTLLGIVCWIFWRAKRREDEAKRGQAGWRSAHSS
jgi:cbb3-type cytochrome oxidase subunit 3